MKGATDLDGQLPRRKEGGKQEISKRKELGGCQEIAEDINPLTPEPPVTAHTRLHCFKKLQLFQLHEHRLNYQL